VIRAYSRCAGHPWQAPTPTEAPTPHRSGSTLSSDSPTFAPVPTHYPVPPLPRSTAHRTPGTNKPTAVIPLNLSAPCVADRQALLFYWCSKSSNNCYEVCRLKRLDSLQENSTPVSGSPRSQVPATRLQARKPAPDLSSLVSLAFGH
jgi:hypothetical protein